MTRINFVKFQTESSDLWTSFNYSITMGIVTCCYLQQVVYVMMKYEIKRLLPTEKMRNCSLIYMAFLS
jgi:hypothetical protein